MLTLPERITVVEVAPRDGLQSLPKPIDTDAKVAMIDRLSEAGFPVIEITGFAHPKVIPNLRDAEEVCARIARRSGTVYRGLAPNARGADRAVAAKVDEVLGLITVSEAYLRRNQNMTLDEGVEQASQAFRIADKAGLAFVMALGMSMWCPYEGAIPEAKVEALVGRFRNAGIRRFYLAGSVGMEDPRHVNRLFARLGKAQPDCEFGFHVHNLAGYGTANVLAALDAGASSVEGSICGIGGGIAMPNSVASVGNLPTEDIVTMLHEMGVKTGLDPQEVVAAAKDVAKILDIVPRSHAAQAGLRQDVLRDPASH
jgi:hydroxymethylglutaryl-CoA lyase